jgi:hypothetical protein
MKTLTEVPRIVSMLDEVIRWIRRAIDDGRL